SLVPAQGVPRPHRPPMHMRLAGFLIRAHRRDLLREAPGAEGSEARGAAWRRASAPAAADGGAIRAPAGDGCPDAEAAAAVRDVDRKCIGERIAELE
ncbi:unnamed protein product, partial [Prorocentrum cordatum]